MNDDERTVFVVDDDPGVRNSIRFLLGTVGLVAETFPSGDEFLEAYDPARSGCLVLDVRMPGMSGLDVQERLHALGSHLPIIFITAHGDVPMAVGAVKAGAMDFIQKPFREQELLDKIQHALEADSRIRSERRDLTEIQARLDSLTPREAEVLELVVAGKPNKRIARALGISQRTVEIHRARVMEKMEVRSVSMLVQLAMKARE
jgi:RNA polymerase sigma factor (sigma-70 family)